MPRLTEEAQRIEGEISDCKMCDDISGVSTGYEELLGLKEAEIKEIKSRRCKTCKWWHVLEPPSGPKGHFLGVCDSNHACSLSSVGLEPTVEDFGCIHWEGRE